MDLRIRFSRETPHPTPRGLLYTAAFSETRRNGGRTREGSASHVLVLGWRNQSGGNCPFTGKIRERLSWPPKAKIAEAKQLPWRSHGNEGKRQMVLQAQILAPSLEQKVVDSRHRRNGCYSPAQPGVDSEMAGRLWE